MNNDLVFVSAQPDVPYFHWQSEIYINNFIEKGINPKNIHVIFALKNGRENPTTGSLNLKKYEVNVHHYIDDRKDKKYIPSIKPFLISKWLEQYPSLGKNFFLHDADIVFREKPNYDDLLKDDIIYLSDTIGYIGYNYIKDCCDRYEKHHPNSNKEQLLDEMVNVVGITIDCVKCNQENSGGGQYIIKNTNKDIWEKIYSDCTPLYNQMLDYQKRFPINPGQIQFWTAEMWSLLWNLWYFGFETKIHNSLDFSWATDDIKTYEKKPILHMAGVTENLKSKKFYKGEYINVNPLDKLKQNINHFDYIDKNSSTIKYIEIMKNIIKNEN
jgi:hypothetical protein